MTSAQDTSASIISTRLGGSQLSYDEGAGGKSSGSGLLGFTGLQASALPKWDMVIYLGYPPLVG
jgi:hypothetical protein